MKREFEVNQKYFDLYLYNKKLEPQKFENDDNPCCEADGPCCCDDCDCEPEDAACEPEDECYDESAGVWKPATPINNDPDILAYGAVVDTIVKAAIHDRDYVCWSNGGYTSQDVFQCENGQMLKAFDVVLFLDNFGFPTSFGLFKGEYEIENNYVRPVFYYVGDNDIQKYRPKCFILGQDLSNY